jgi:hypothetical protein
MQQNEKPWIEIEVKSWDWFDQQLERLKPRQWLFRGHSDSEWDLRTSLDRLFDEVQPIIRYAKGANRKFAKRTHEDLLIKTFQKSSNLYLEFLPDETKTLEWLAIMQHHGAPTRLLDVTLSPHIAVYFALEFGSGASCIFAFNNAEIKKINQSILQKDTYREMQEEVFSNKKRFVTVFEPEYGNQRLVIQQGLFLVPSQADVPFEQMLADYPQFADDDICIKYIFAPKLRFQGLERLNRMNITAATLFPGIDGFCRSLRFQVLETTKSQQLLE